MIANAMGVSEVTVMLTVAVYYGGYALEHANALIDVGAAIGFGIEHVGALADLGAATGFAIEHASALTDVGEAGR